MSRKTISDNRLQEIAAFHMLPFGVDIFQNSPLQLRHSKPLPLGDPEVLTREVVDALAASIERGTLAFLSRQGAWQKRMVADTGRDDPRHNQRGIGQEQWRGAGRRLAFSKHSIESVIFAYNAMCSASGMPVPKTRNYPKSVHPSTKLNGDLLASHIVWKRLDDANFRIADVALQSFGRNPLTRLVTLNMPEEEDALAVVNRLFQDDLEPSWPWLTKYVANYWSYQLLSRWESLDRFDKLNRGLAHFGEALFTLAEQRNRKDYLLVFIEFFRDVLAVQKNGAEIPYEKNQLNSFNKIARQLKLSERDSYRQMWSRWVDLCQRIRTEYEDIRQIHPIDREAGDKVFMSTYEQEPFAEIAHRAHVFSNTLRGVIGA